MNLLPYFPLILMYILEFDTTSLIPDVLLCWMHSIWIFFLSILFLMDIGFFLRRLLNSIWREFCVLVPKPLDSHGTYEELCIFPEELFYIDDYRNASIMFLREKLCCVFPEWEPLKIKAKCKLYQQNMYVHQWCRFCSCCILSYS